MRASEWQFLCAVHEQPKSCCAIDYCCHTLDWAANVVTNPKLFPSRVVAPGSGSDGSGHDKNSQAVKSLVNVFRRLHRIFAHAWFQHRGVFWSVEGQTGLYVFFKTVCDTYDTLPAENYKLPPEAEGLEGTTGSESNERGAKRDPLMPAPTILQRTEEDSHLLPSRTNTRRHIRGSPSTGSAVTTVLEAEEDEYSDVSNAFREMRITAPPLEEEPEVADVPVIVEQGMIEEPRSISGPQEESTTNQAEDHRDRKPTVSEQEIEADDKSGVQEPAHGAEEKEPSKADEAESVVGTHGDGQDEVPESREADEPVESEPPSSATNETAPADVSVQDFADQEKPESSEATADEAPAESEQSKQDDKSKEDVSGS